MLPFTINYYVQEFMRIIYHPGTELQTHTQLSAYSFLLISINNYVVYNYSTIINFYAQYGMAYCWA